MTEYGQTVYLNMVFPVYRPFICPPDGVCQDLLLWSEAAGHLRVSPQEPTGRNDSAHSQTEILRFSGHQRRLFLCCLRLVLSSLPSGPHPLHQFHSSSSFMCAALSVPLCISFLSFILITSSLLFPPSVAAGIVLFQQLLLERPPQ